MPLILGMLNINLIMARAAQAAKSFTRAAKWMQTADFSKSVIITTAKVSLMFQLNTCKDNAVVKNQIPTYIIAHTLLLKMGIHVC